MTQSKIDKVMVDRYPDELINEIIRLREEDREVWYIIAQRVGVSVNTAKALYRSKRGHSNRLLSYTKSDVCAIIELREKGFDWQEIKERLGLAYTPKGISNIFYKSCKRIEHVKERPFKMPIMRSNIHEAMRIACQISGVVDHSY